MHFICHMIISITYARKPYPFVSFSDKTEGNRNSPFTRKESASPIGLKLDGGIGPLRQL